MFPLTWDVSHKLFWASLTEKSYWAILTVLALTSLQVSCNIAPSIQIMLFCFFVQHENCLTTSDGTFIPQDDTLMEKELLAS